MDIVKLNKEDLPEVKTLWEELNQIHLEKSKYFKSYYSEFSFENRLHALYEKERIETFVLKDKDEKMGYCIASIENKKGEIDSIYVKPSAQKKGMGKLLMDEAMKWFHENGIQKVSVSIAVGNEAVLKFYRKYHFRERLITMELPPQEKDIKP